MATSPYWTIERTADERIITWPNWSNIKLSRQQAEYVFGCNAHKVIHMAGRNRGKDFLDLLRATRRIWPTYFSRVDNPSWRRAGVRYQLSVMSAEADNYKDCITKLHDFLPMEPGVCWWNKGDECFYVFGENEIRIQMVSLYGSGGARGPGDDDIVITECQLLKEAKFLAEVLPRTNRGGYDGRITINGTGENNWFDEAFCQAVKGDLEDFYGDFTAISGTSFDQPVWSEDHPSGMKDDVAAAILREYPKNPARFLRERLGRPKIEVPADVQPDNPIHEGLLNCAFVKERIPLEGPPLVIFDLMYGGTDRLARGVWNKNRCALVRGDVWTAGELDMRTNDPYPALAKLFTETASIYPGCVIAYDAQGRYGGAVSAHVPRHIKLMPMRRDDVHKNQHVEDFILRLTPAHGSERASGITLPHPESPHLTARERHFLAELKKEVLAYRRVDRPVANGRTKYYYTKGEGVGDDIVDMLTWSCSQLPKVNAANIREDPRRVGRAILGA